MTLHNLMGSNWFDPSKVSYLAAIPGFFYWLKLWYGKNPVFNVVPMSYCSVIPICFISMESLSSPSESLMCGNSF